MRKIKITAHCDAYLRETWELDVPESVKDEDVFAYAEQALDDGECEFISQEIDGENNRTITAIDGVTV